MFRFVSVMTFIGFLTLGPVAVAQDVPGLPQPAIEHELLQRFAGKWSVDQEANMGPGQPVMKGKGSIESRMLGKFWVINEFTSGMGGVNVTGIQTVGFDQKRGKYVGTWVDSMTDTLWQYTGTVDDSGRVLTLEAEGPNLWAQGEMTLYRDIYEFKSDDEILVSSKILTGDDEWVTFMTGTATRQTSDSEQ